MTGGAEPDLIAVLLVAASASGANVIFRWPPKPRLPVRFSCPKPIPVGEGGVPAQMLIDAAYGCSHNISNERAEEIVAKMGEDPKTDIYADEKYLWHRSRVGGGGSGTSKNSSSAGAGASDTRRLAPLTSGAISGSDSASGTAKTPNAHDDPVPKPKTKARGPSSQAKYEDILGYEASFLADLLSPVPTMCHQKFELVVDELAFIGHPVHAKVDGSWDFAELSGRPAPPSSSATFGGAETDGGGDVRGRIHDRPSVDDVPPRAYSQQPRQHKFQIAADDGEEGDTEEPPRPRRPSLTRSKTTSRSTGSGSGGGHGHALHTLGSSTYRRLPSSRQFPAQLKSFHLVLVLDRPDPSSLASTDLDLYIDAYYTQFAFKLTAAMLYEQGRSNFIAQEAHSLLALREKYLSNTSSPPQSDAEFNRFFEKVLRESSLASAVRIAYEAVVSSSICQVMINSVPVNIQLPPGHLDLLKVGTQNLGSTYTNEGLELELDENDEEEGVAEERLEDELRFGWKVPPLRPWKTVVLLDHAIKPTDIVVAGRRITSGNPMMNPTEALPRFMAAASPTMTLYAIAQAMKVDLETELYSLVRLLVYNRKAKILDVVRMVNIYTLPPLFPRPLDELTHLFSLEFPALSPLPILLSALSVSHRTFASIVGPSTSSSGPSTIDSPQRSDFFRVLIWMLLHDLLVMLHVRVRIYIHREIKVAALKSQRAEKAQKAALRAKKAKRKADVLNKSNGQPEDKENGRSTPRIDSSGRLSVRSTSSRRNSRSPGSVVSNSNGTPGIPPSTRHRHAVSFDKKVTIEDTLLTHAPTLHGKTSESTLNDEKANGSGSNDSSDDEDEDESSDPHRQPTATAEGAKAEDGNGSNSNENERKGSGRSSELETSELEEDEDTDLTPSFLQDPERATRGQRRWLDEICRGEDPAMVRGFRKITPYIDGKTTTDEIMYRTGMARGQLRDILRHFDAHLILFLHP